jgi:hypothetical protein
MMSRPLLDDAERRFVRASFRDAERSGRSLAGCYCGAIDAAQKLHPEIPRQRVAMEVVALLTNDILVREVAANLADEPRSVRRRASIAGGWRARPAGCAR